MSFSEQPPSEQWAALKYRGEVIAEVWFKPEGEPFALTFRVPRKSFDVPGVGPRLTAENLLKAVGVPSEEVESWRCEGASDPGADGPNPELGRPLPPPPPDVAHLTIHVRLRPPPPAEAPDESGEPEAASVRWQDLEARWNAILGLEASIDTLRMRLEGVLTEIDSASKRPLTTEEKVHALNSDVAQWNKAKTRVHYSLPKVKEFIHRATWAVATPERKKLEEIFKDHVQPQVAFPEMDKVPGQLESLLKARQVLSAQGVTVLQECQGIVADIQGAFRTLQSNAASRVLKERNAKGARSKKLR